MRPLAVVLLPLLFLAACSAPPQKEIDLAQGAMDAARAAGAERYAPQQLGAAQTSLEQAHEAVAQRDYRLALTRALDAHDRALAAARSAAEGQARARGEIDAAIASATAAIETLELRLKAPGTARLPKAVLTAARRTVTAAEEELQKAGAAVTAGDYETARQAVEGISGRISEQIEALDAAATAKPARPPRRGR
ncbi:MAG: hypothetical protein WEB50_15510 [Vicinamibacterales bacterium]